MSNSSARAAPPRSLRGSACPTAALGHQRRNHQGTRRGWARLRAPQGGHGAQPSPGGTRSRPQPGSSQAHKSHPCRYPHPAPALEQTAPRTTPPHRKGPLRRLMIGRGVAPILFSSGPRSCRRRHGECPGRAALSALRRRHPRPAAPPHRRALPARPPCTRLRGYGEHRARDPAVGLPPVRARW